MPDVADIQRGDRLEFDRLDDSFDVVDNRGDVIETADGHALGADTLQDCLDDGTVAVVDRDADPREVEIVAEPVDPAGDLIRIRGTIVAERDSGAVVVDGDGGETYVRKPGGQLARLEDHQTRAGEQTFEEMVAWESDLPDLGGDAS